ncbi:ATP-dependent Clp protease adapter protein CLPS2, chloroplastic-like [Curcuma longa]|uniref:ATP-dependent Clp protease adapter protein CLPS2, chloroplastic-like n=1 Tax=Curcuma longa TaxID=136217 RepID=UPI003D9E0DD9
MAISSRGVVNFILAVPVPCPPSLPLSTAYTSPSKPRVGVRLAAAISGPVSVIAGFGASKGGSGLLERPSFDLSQFDAAPQVQEGGDIGRLTTRKAVGRGDSYKVLLIDDPKHTEKFVENVLPQVVPSVTSDLARVLFHESREIGVALVIVTVKEHAEFYAQMMTLHGLRSAIEADSNLET